MTLVCFRKDAAVPSSSESAPFREGSNEWQLLDGSMDRKFGTCSVQSFNLVFRYRTDRFFARGSSGVYRTSNYGLVTETSVRQCTHK